MSSASASILPVRRSRREGKRMLSANAICSPHVMTCRLYRQLPAAADQYDCNSVYYHFLDIAARAGLASRERSRRSGHLGNIVRPRNGLS
jgi:hypothetical protein